MTALERQAQFDATCDSAIAAVHAANVAVWEAIAGMTGETVEQVEARIKAQVVR